MQRFVRFAAHRKILRVKIIVMPVFVEPDAYDLAPTRLLILIEQRIENRACQPPQFTPHRL